MKYLFNKRIMRRLLFFAACVMSSQLVWGVQARQNEFTHVQKDGTQLTLRLVGDEFSSYYLDAAGQAYQVTVDGDYAPLSQGDLRERLDNGAKRRAMANRERVKRLPLMAAMREKAEGGPMKAIGSFGNMTGTKNGIVILVNFADVTFKSANNQTAFYNQFNQKVYSKNGHIGSVKDYFEAQSYGKFSIDFDVVGPVTVSNTMAYYGAHSGSNNDSHVADMIIEAVHLADAQCGVDFSKYDWDGDKRVDQVFVIFAGYNEAQGGGANTIWPHEWDLYSSNYFGNGDGPQSIDGVIINTYACTSELCGSSGSTIDGIGTACHEFSHCLGYPDLYDTDGSTNGSGNGMAGYDLMCSGSYNGPEGSGEVPCGYSAYERWMAGWLTPTELTEPITIENMASVADSPEAYIIYNDNNRDEYFILENRQAKGYFTYNYNWIDGGHGMLISHVDYDEDEWFYNTVNIYSSHQRFTYVPADGSYDFDLASATALFNSVHGDFFPGNSNVRSFTSSSHNSAGGRLFNRNSAGTYTLLNQDVTDITETSGKISFKFNGGSPVDTGVHRSITLDPCGGTVTPGAGDEWSGLTWTQPKSYIGLVLPEPATDIEGWYGIGWSLTKYTEQVALDDIALIDYKVEYLPAADVTLYAIYCDNDYNATCYPPVPEPEPEIGTTPPHFGFCYEAKLGQPFGAPKARTKSDGALTYTSSDPTVAEVNPTTGALTLKKTGVVTITVTQAATATYNGATASYLLKVSE